MLQLEKLADLKFIAQGGYPQVASLSKKSMFVISIDTVIYTS